MKIGILTGGGDVPGLNPCIRSITLSADDNGWEVVGFKRGWQGVLEIDPDDPESVAANSLPLTRHGVRGLDRLGGTILHTSRMDPRTHQQGDKTSHVLHVLDRLGVDAMVTLGGDGTLRFSAHLSRQGFPVVSIPKTMDNDVFGTDYCIGFSTAVSRSVEAINALRTTIESHERIGIIELFGRRSGETALLAGFLAMCGPGRRRKSMERLAQAADAVRRCIDWKSGIMRTMMRPTAMSRTGMATAISHDS